MLHTYDSNHVYNLFEKQFSNVDIVIPPRINSIDDKQNHWMRNRNLREIKCYGRMNGKQIVIMENEIKQRVRSVNTKNFR